MVLPPCLIHVKADQQHDVLTALGRLPPEHRQDVLDERQARSQGGTVRNVVAYFFGLVKRVFAGEFRLWAGRKTFPPGPQPDAKLPARGAHTGVPPTPLMQPASRETALAHIANIRTMLRAPVSAGDIAARVMTGRRWLPDPA
ncbi:hypothetical protein [Kosakonia sp. S42]|uniref:hypothetical protein n=1 Tax=Kosakonia sp. S42 TaxID=2767458 RepID=UPI00190E1134|nr:hypothetical protein [Kosakonia sp. S42]